MAEAYDAAIRRRLSTIDSMGQSAMGFARQRAQGESMRQPADFGAGGPMMRQPGGQGGSYRGPRGNQAALIAFGKMLEGRGFRVSENPAFGNGRVGRHTQGSRHYSGRAIDVNRYPGTSRREQQAIDQIVGLAKGYGLRTIWRQKDHFNHAHFDY